MHMYTKVSKYCINLKCVYDAFIMPILEYGLFCVSLVWDEPYAISLLEKCQKRLLYGFIGGLKMKWLSDVKLPLMTARSAMIPRVWSLPQKRENYFTVFVYFCGIGVLFQFYFFRLISTTKTEDQVEGGLLLNVIIRKSTTIFQLFTGKDQTLLIRRDT